MFNTLTFANWHLTHLTAEANGAVINFTGGLFEYLSDPQSYCNSSWVDYMNVYAKFNISVVM